MLKNVIPIAFAMKPLFILLAIGSIFFLPGLMAQQARPLEPRIQVAAERQGSQRAVEQSRRVALEQVIQLELQFPKPSPRRKGFRQ